ncbi:type I methionyl aminopeptidase [Spirochaeta cellobiosiphila]|uniref:type I methionyl aminopeptidase n=1 Tax=Spirochaeta cellobiosiphila TaxID=504483 RepID=UPI000401EE77|nr:type I methionyl aminopeptidase [Spirochaeta cellobiosiphila]
MIITNEEQFQGISQSSEVAAKVLKELKAYSQPGKTTYELDLLAKDLLYSYGAKSAPKLAYDFPGYVCISINNEFCHGIPSKKKYLNEGDIINIDVSVELNGYWSDNGESFLLASHDTKKLKLIETSRIILNKAIENIKSGEPLSSVGFTIETLANRNSYYVIRNLGGHGVGLSLHEDPDCILNYPSYKEKGIFLNNSIVAIETFISTKSHYAVETNDGWTMVGDNGGLMAQHEHTIMVTEGKPIILTKANGI